MTDRPNRIAIAGSNNYAAVDFVIATIAKIPNDAVVLLTAYCGVNRIANREAQRRNLTIERVRWDCKPRIILEALPTAILIFYDPSTPYLRDLARAAAAAGIPCAIFDGDGKSLDLASKLCATIPASPTSTLANGGRPKMPIVDQALDNVRDTFTTKVKVPLTLPESIYQSYERQAELSKQPIEKVLTDRLRRCVDHTAMKPLYFNDVQRAELERITGGHVVNSPDAALTHIRTTCEVKIEDVEVVFSPKVLQRAAARAKSCRMTTEAWMQREILQNMERSVGVRPY